MSPTLPPDGCELSADDLNERIRAFWIDGRGHPAVALTDVQRAEYQRLLAALRAVERGDVAEAA
ncbi:hypothetical protein ADK57_25560 [Streptomyces sp. MMG1533]|uniref:hypothetical protein n=1 Tax=Streptomyces sp. MMG1533 TaxID=1415546 RepID=UPI0006ADED6E|nr:hypothetical protein [Streptomyces sp. MMG1533]KOU62018.1 hypothetical protein ADK57_25560 [Streptomyces sp. MMG1533]